MGVIYLLLLLLGQVPCSNFLKLKRCICPNVYVETTLPAIQAVKCN
jgi:hypothetical protein